jgi:hydroxyacylglutathione hydrolase
MIVHNIKTGDWKENCFIVEGDDHSALIIDPGDNFEDITSYLTDKKLIPVAIVNTHGHFDHVGAVNQLKEKYSIKFHLHKKETALLKRANLYKVAFVGKGNIPPTTIDAPFEDDTTSLSIAPFELIIHQTPGHTSGGVCIQIENYLFTGDTLLSSNLIPKKLPEENRPLLKKSFEYLQTLNPDLIVAPGHGSQIPLGKQISHLLENWKEQHE